jgi:hypothetical protein
VKEEFFDNLGCTIIARRYLRQRFTIDILPPAKPPLCEPAAEREA